MGEVAKWALLIAGLAVLIGLIFVLPFVSFLDVGKLGSSIAEFTAILSPYLSNARGLINNFFSPFGRNVLNGLLIYLFAKWAVKLSVKIIAWAYHFIFK